MQQLLRAPRAPLMFSLMSVIGLGVFILAVAVVMQPASVVVGMDRVRELVCLQVAFTPERAAAVVLSFPQDAREAISELLVPGDVTLAWGYGLVLAGLTALLAMRLPGKWIKVGAVIMWAPLLATVMDCIEDIFLYSVVRQIAADETVQVVPMLTLLASTAATVKYIALAVVTPIYGVAGIIKGLSVDRSFAALTVYALLAFVLFNITVRPLQGIPTCF
ncbi:MAG: hypothetical protein QF790_07230 [Gammaproteobacteria bacterium]|jgi:aryl carrier-like protein|nr:hypothetical protein [Gammaproteobacteria bacterium]MDP6616937.1 hypothetical protein [Gammaproteobacteria bacterium]MDP6696039.1 hypothetical protein [Gammaproteobacteria bacterium]MDP7041179.1 hypothetical protein [Gammaproteobacteria bacterium]